MMCALYGVTRGGFYAWQAREPSARSLGDAELTEHVARVHRHSRGFYGSPRVVRKLRQQGVNVGQRKVARLMRLARLQGRSARLYRRSRVRQHAFFASIANSQRAVTLQATDQIWVADVTYLRVAGLWRYLAVVMDKHSRRIIGWSLSQRRDVALTLAALRHAVGHRQPAPGCVFHTDRGIEYAAFVSGQLTTPLRIWPSVDQRRVIAMRQGSKASYSSTVVALGNSTSKALRYW